jgi:hypothetical protein
MRPVWKRSVTIDEEGIPWAKAGIRADFIYVLFCHGFSVEELQNTLLDGFTTDRVIIEDAIRYCMWRDRKAAPKRSVDAR